MPLLSTVSLLGISLWLQIHVRVRAELAFLTAICMVVLVLYLAALGGWLASAVMLTHAVGFLLGTVAIVQAVRSAPKNRAAILLAMLTFTALAAMAWDRLEFGAYTTWDEFSHWGRMAKALSASDVLPTATSGILFKDYPPGTGLLQYFVVHSSFSEGATYFAQALMLVAAVLSLLKWSGWATAPQYCLGLAVGLALMEILGLGYATVEADHVVGALFGASLGAYAVNEQSDLPSTLALVPVLFCLPLMKPIAIVMAFSAAVVIGLDVLRTAEHRSLPWIGVCVLVVAAPVIAHQSWSAWVRAQNFNRTFQVSLTAEGLRAVAEPAARTATQQAVATNFRRAIDQASLGLYGNGTVDAAGVWTGGQSRLRPRSVTEWFVCLAGLSVLAMLLLPRGTRITHAVVHAALCLGSLVYMALLLYVYFYGFGEYEAVRVSSFGRYASPWFLAWALAVVAALGLAARGNPLQYGVSVIVLLVSVAWSGMREPPRRTQLMLATAAERRVVYAISRSIERTIPQSAPTYIIWQNSTGFPLHVMAYELIPRRTNASCWSLGQRYHEDDIWTCPWSPEQFSLWLENYDYLLIARADERFWETYQTLFEGGASTTNRSALLFERIQRQTPPVFRSVSVPPSR